MSQTKPIIILVPRPGAWHEPDIFDPVTTVLQSLGYKTVSVSLPSVGASLPRMTSSPTSTLRKPGTSQYEIVEDGMEIMTFFPITTLCNDLPRDAAERYAPGLKRQSYKVFASKQTYAAWRHVLTTYLYTEKDVALPIRYQKMMVKGSGVNIATEIFDSGHSVFLAIPERSQIRSEER
ncbi:hypothetical protein FRC05_006403 [Tulasnella sp. 425]|nr:hypothetical protein FRC05_006403 [Tulasnella sp. 425]